MKRFYKKLKSARGASILFALLLFLMCAMVGAVVLTAVSANAGRHTHLEEEQRKYFSVASALELLQGQMDQKVSVTVQVQCVETETWRYELNAGAYELKKETETEYTVIEPAAGVDSPYPYYEYLLMKNCLPDGWWTELETGAGARWAAYSGGFSETCTIDPPTGYEESMYLVTVAVNNGADGENYALEMQLTTKDNSPLKVVWTAEPVVKRDSEVKTVGNIDDSGTTTTTTTITCTLQWSEEDRTVTFA